MYFDNFVLNEAVSKKKNIQVILLSNVNEESKSVPAFENECKAKGVKFNVIGVDKCKLTKIENTENYLIVDADSKVKINVDNTVILTRRGVVKNTYTKDIVEQLETLGFFVVNTLESIVKCENKYTTSKILQDAGIPTPRMALIENESQMDEAIKTIGGQFPVILKMLSGSQGIGVSIIDSEASLKSVLQTLWKANPHVELLIQEKIESEFDLRIHVLNRRFNAPVVADDDSEILGAMQRNKIKKDFRTNYSLGGTVQKVKLTKEQEEIAIASAKAIGCTWCGVDIIVDKKTKKNYVLEVNASPGTEGLRKATGINVVGDVIDYVTNTENWTKQKRLSGFREVIAVPGIGEIVAKFDTGNGALCSSLTYDTIKVSDNKKTVEWTLGNKKLTNKVYGISQPEVGDKIVDRYIIKLDIVFCGHLYKDVEVALADRTDKSTKFLANRKLMERFGVSVSPFKTFVCTSFSGEYSAKETKGKNNLGIKFE